MKSSNLRQAALVASSCFVRESHTEDGQMFVYLCIVGVSVNIFLFILTWINQLLMYVCVFHSCILATQQFPELLGCMWFACNFRFAPCHMLLCCGMHLRTEKRGGAIPDMIIKMIFYCGEAGREPTPRSIKPEPRKPLLPLALDMFMFQLHYVKQPPTHNVFVWVPLCKCEWRSASVCVCLSVVGESLFFLSGRFHVHIFLLADLTEEQLNWG